MKLKMLPILMAMTLSSQVLAQSPVFTPYDARYLVNPEYSDDENCPTNIFMTSAGWADTGVPEFIRALYPNNPARQLASADANTRSYEIDMIDYAPAKLTITVTLTSNADLTWNESEVDGGFPVCQHAEYQSGGVAQ